MLLDQLGFIQKKTCSAMPCAREASRLTVKKAYHKIGVYKLCPAATVVRREIYTMPICQCFKIKTIQKKILTSMEDIWSYGCFHNTYYFTEL